jgi:hypothetical protein
MHGRGSHTTSSWPSVRFGTQDAHTHFAIMLLVVDNIVRTTNESLALEAVSAESGGPLTQGKCTTADCYL